MKRVIPGRINSDHCGHCGLDATPEGHDGCLGTLPGDVMNACCGHGNNDSAYIQFNHDDYENNPNKNRVSGQKAINLQAKLIFQRFEKANEDN